MWQDLRAELHPQGVEIVTVALESTGAEACRPFVEAAQAQHPSLVDVDHVVLQRFGMVNIPNGVWIDEQGTIVRPAEPANPRDDASTGRMPPVDGLPDRMSDILAEASRIRLDTRYAGALRDWAARGSASRYVLPPDEVLRRSVRRDAGVAAGQAHFELGSHLWRQGDRSGAEHHWRQAHELDPDNIAAKRQAWSLASPGTGPFERFWQGPVPGQEEAWPYASDWLRETRQRGAESYYPPLEL